MILHTYRWYCQKFTHSVQYWPKNTQITDIYVPSLLKCEWKYSKVRLLKLFEKFHVWFCCKFTHFWRENEEIAESTTKNSVNICGQLSVHNVWGFGLFVGCRHRVAPWQMLLSLFLRRSNVFSDSLKCTHVAHTRIYHQWGSNNLRP